MCVCIISCFLATPYCSSVKLVNFDVTKYQLFWNKLLFILEDKHVSVSILASSSVVQIKTTVKQANNISI